MIINGKEISKEIKDNLKEKICKIKNNNNRIPNLTVIIVGEDKASQTYVRNKENACNYIGMNSNILKYNTVTEEELISVINKLNNDDSVDGILVQLPLPNYIDESNIINAISPRKDVDGFHPENIAKLFLGEKGFVPCTPRGIIYLLKAIKYDLSGKNVVILNRSNIVGKPLSLLCLKENATVTICHSKTKNIKQICKQADVIVSATGKAKMIDENYIKKDVIIIDVGMNLDEKGKLCGDVDFDKVEHIAKAITPVPGGVGPMTIAMLLENTLEAYYENNNINI